ncbi:hypothetical protein Hanom_Chr11g01038171 [Helianthus anomalus]
MAWSNGHFGNFPLYNIIILYIIVLFIVSSLSIYAGHLPQSPIINLLDDHCINFCPNYNTNAFSVCFIFIIE